MLFKEKDITDKKFLSSNPFWNALSHSTAIIEFTPGGEIISANDNFLNLTGYSLDEIRGNHHRMFCSPDEINSKDYFNFWKDLESGKFFSGTFPRFNKFGQKVWLEASYNPVIRKGQVIKVIKIASDVTTKIEQSNNSSFMIDAIHRAMAVIEFDLSGYVLSANQNFSDVMGYSEAEIIGKHHRLFCERRMISSHEYSVFWKELNKGVYRSGQFPRVKKNGQKVWLEATYNPVLDENGNVTKVIKIAKDISSVVNNRISDENNAQEVYSLTQCATKLSRKNKDVLTVSSKKVEDIKGMMEDSKEMMTSLSKKVADINQLVQKVKDISHQTHLLSLNASIEAATAGAHGKGFSVVAAEVKRLAGITKDASEHISKVIDEIKDDTKNAMKKINSCAEQSNETNQCSKEAQEGLEKITQELNELVNCVKRFSTISNL